MDNTGSWKCDSCGAELRAKAQFCTECGSACPSPKCSNCETELKLSWKFCEQCGTSTSLSPEPKPIAEPSIKAKAKEPKVFAKTTAESITEWLSFSSAFSSGQPGEIARIDLGFHGADYSKCTLKRSPAQMLPGDAICFCFGYIPRMFHALGPGPGSARYHGLLESCGNRISEEFEPGKTTSSFGNSLIETSDKPKKTWWAALKLLGDDNLIVETHPSVYGDHAAMAATSTLALLESTWSSLDDFWRYLFLVGLGTVVDYCGTRSVKQLELIEAPERGILAMAMVLDEMNND